MAPPRWGLFAGMAILLVVAMLGLARATQAALASPGPSPNDAPPDGTPTPAERTLSTPSMGTGLLLANVALSHGLIGTLLAAGAWYAEMPPSALGLASPVGEAVPIGVGLGVALYAASEASARIADISGMEYDERLRELLAPETPRGWLVLLLVVLPAVAGVEELLFRGALVGALAAGFGLPAWGLAAVSSALFGLGHGLQGPAGVVVTAALGFALAAAFVLTDSLAAVIVAHYLINALEFVVQEGVGS